MQVDVAVKMKAEFIYDLLLFHTYSKLSGFLVNVLGLAVMITGGFLVGAGKVSVYQGGAVFCSGHRVFGVYTDAVERQVKASDEDAEVSKRDDVFIFGRRNCRTSW